MMTRTRVTQVFLLAFFLTGSVRAEFGLVHEEPGTRQVVTDGQLVYVLKDGGRILQFASGVAHELNNPLMAVAGHAELALKKGAHEESVGQLAEAARRAAEVVARLQRITDSSQETGP